MKKSQWDLCFRTLLFVLAFFVSGCVEYEDVDCGNAVVFPDVVYFDCGTIAHSDEVRDVFLSVVGEKLACDVRNDDTQYVLYPEHIIQRQVSNLPENIPFGGQFSDCDDRANFRLAVLEQTTEGIAVGRIDGASPNRGHAWIGVVTDDYELIEVDGAIADYESITNLHY